MTRNPTRWRPVVFAALGYAYIAAVVAATVLAAAVLMAHGQYRLVWIPGTLLFVILPALWIRIPAPEGRVVTRNEYPDLFRAIDRVRERLEAPAPDVVLLTEEVNAFVLERPLFGIAGWPRRYLGVGLPLMRAFAPDEFEAILAHEFAHLSREHSRSTRWLVRVSATWHVLVLGLEYSRHWGGFVFRPFFRWYMPRLDAVTLGVSRQHEFESDRLAAQVVGNQVAARALLRTVVCDRYLNDVVWRAICRESAAHAFPPADVLGRVLDHLQSPVPSAELEHAVRASLRDRTLETDSHPRVADRMRALGAPAGEQDVATWVGRLAERDGPDAAEVLLGRDGTRTLAEELGTSWQARIAESWEQLHTDARRWQEALAAPASAEQPLAEPDVLWARARWASQCEPPGGAIPHFRRVLEQAPGHHEALTQLGMVLLEDAGEEEQREGAQMLEASLRREARLAITAAEALQEYYTRARRPEDVRRCRAREPCMGGEVGHSTAAGQLVAERVDPHPYGRPRLPSDAAR